MVPRWWPQHVLLARGRGRGRVALDPLDADGIVSAIRRVLEEEPLFRSLRRRGLERARLFSWWRAAADHAALYREVAAARTTSMDEQGMTRDANEA